MLINGRLRNGKQAIMEDRCGLCGGAGWILECNPTQTPVELYLLPCLIPDCDKSGQQIKSFNIDTLFDGG